MYRSICEARKNRAAPQKWPRDGPRARWPPLTIVVSVQGLCVDKYSCSPRIVVAIHRSMPASLAELARSGDAVAVAEALAFTPSPRRGRQVDEELADSGGFTPLLLAAWHGHADVVSALLDASCDVNRRLPNGTGAIYLAARNGHAEAVDILLQAGAEVEFGAARSL
eukprot:COSAG05_NODE_1417_length_4940_cov_7.065895_1_plen_167_part_00